MSKRNYKEIFFSGYKIGLCLALMASSIGCGRSSSPFGGLVFSPDNKYIVLVYSRANSSFIYKVPIDTGKATRLTSTTGGFEGVPSFSLDGKRIAYSYTAGEKAHSYIVIANADGSNPMRWPDSGANDFNPVFMPDGKGVVFSRAGFYGNYSPIARPAWHELNLYMADLDGTNIRQLTNENFYNVSRASVSPDGKTLLFVTSRTDGDVIEFYSLEQAPKPSLVVKPGVKTRSGDASVSDVMFLPDGKSVLLSAATDSASGPYDYDIYRVDLRGQPLEKLTNANGFSYGLQLSTDGKTAVFMRDISHWYGNKTEIVLLDMATHKLTPLNITGLK